MHDDNNYPLQAREIVLNSICELGSPIEIDNEEISL